MVVFLRYKTNVTYRKFSFFFSNEALVLSRQIVDFARTHGIEPSKLGDQATSWLVGGLEYYIFFQ